MNSRTDNYPAEYLRRNLLVAKAVGAISLADSILKRLGAAKRPPKWLVEQTQGIRERLDGLPRELAAYRGELPATRVSGEQQQKQQQSGKQ